MISRRYIWLAALGALFVLLGALLPSSVLVEASGVTEPARLDALRLGATLAKVFSAVLGLACVGVAFLLSRAATPDDGPALDFGSARDRTWLAVVLVGALGLRLIALDSGLWYDEIVTLVKFVRLPLDQLALTYTSLNNHMLFSLAARVSVVIFGESEWALRLPAALFGVASIAATWWLATQVVDRREALLVAVLMTVSYHHIWFSQNARGYTGLLFFTIVATTIFLEGMRRRARALWLVYALVFALAMYVHLSAVFSFLAHALIWGVLWVWRKTRRIGAEDRLPGAGELWPLLGFGFGSLIILWQYGILFPQMVHVYETKMAVQTKGGISEWKNPLWTALEIIRVLALNPVMALGIPVGGSLMAIGFFRFLKKDPLLAVLLVVHVPLTAIILIAIEFHIWPRYFLVDMGFFLIILVHGTFAVAGFIARKIGKDERMLSTVAVVLGICVSAVTVPRNYMLPKQDYEGAVRFVEAERKAGEPIVTLGIIEDPLRDYYGKAFDKVETDEDLARVRTSTPTWVLTSFPAQLRSHHPKALAVIERDFELVKVFPGTLSGGEVFVYRDKTPPKRAAPTP